MVGSLRSDFGLITWFLIKFRVLFWFSLLGLFYLLSCCFDWFGLVLDMMFCILVGQWLFAFCVNYLCLIWLFGRFVYLFIGFAVFVSVGFDFIEYLVVFVLIDVVCFCFNLEFWFICVFRLAGVGYAWWFWCLVVFWFGCCVYCFFLCGFGFDEFGLIVLSTLWWSFEELLLFYLINYLSCCVFMICLVVLGLFIVVILVVWFCPCVGFVWSFGVVLCLDVL